MTTKRRKGEEGRGEILRWEKVRVKECKCTSTSWRFETTKRGVKEKRKIENFDELEKKGYKEKKQ